MNILVQNRFWVIGWLILVHTSGLIGLNLSPEFFLAFTPLNLILSALLLLGMQERINYMIPLMWFAAAFAGWFVEVVGVNTGWIFGDYSYGRTLGIQMVGVPLLIGVNWATLILAGLQVARHQFLISSRGLAALSVAGILLVLDVLMEFVAPKLDFWTFYSGNKSTSFPGVHNFAGWAITGFVISYALHPYLSRGVNRMAPVYLLIQILFFAALAITLP